MSLNSKKSTWVWIFMILAAGIGGTISGKFFDGPIAAVAMLAIVAVLGLIGRFLVKRFEDQELARMHHEKETPHQ